MGSRPIQKEQLDALMIGLMSRGRDATGVALQEVNGEIHSCKHWDNAQVFIKSRRYEDFIEERLKENIITAIVHTRLATCGHWSKDENNHPLIGDNVALVHNGMIHNHKALFSQLQMEPKCETDSDIIRAMVDKDGLTRKTIREMGKLQGSAAIAVLDKREPGKLLIARSGNPLEVALTEDFVYGASLIQPIKVANRVWTTRWGFVAHCESARIHKVILPAETAWLIDINAKEPGLQWHQEFKTAPYTHYWHNRWEEEDYRDFWKKNAGDKGLEHQKRLATEVVTNPQLDMRSTGVEYKCPHCGKKTYVPMWLEGDKYSPEKLTCGNCHKYMNGAKLIVGKLSSPQTERMLPTSPGGAVLL